MSYWALSMKPGRQEVGLARDFGFHEEPQLEKNAIPCYDGHRE